jgi:hypothetical protein
LKVGLGDPPTILSFNRLMKKSPPIGHLGNNRVNITGNLS